MHGETVVHDGRETDYWVDDEPDGDTTVLYVHGSGCNNRVWVEQTDREGVTSTAVDLSGHAGSEDVDLEAGPGTMRAYADDVDAVAREVAADVLVGHSLGGAVVLTQLLEGDHEASGAVIADSGSKLGVGPALEGALGGDIDPVVDFMARHDILFHGDDHPHLETSLDVIRGEGMRILKRDLMSCNTFDVRDRLGEIEVPTLCVVGDNDKLTPPDLSSYLAEHLPAGEYAEVPGAAHMAMLENADSFNAHLDDFLARTQ